MLGEFEVINIHPEVLHDEGVMHEIGEFSRNWKVTETHHLFGGVDDDRVVDTGSVRLWIFLRGETLCGFMQFHLHKSTQ